MSAKRYCYSRPFKIVVVGELESGKTRLVRKFISGGLDTEPASTFYKPTSVCDGFKLALRAVFKQRVGGEIFRNLTSEEVTNRLTQKSRFSDEPTSPVASAVPVTTSDDLAWDDISVELQELEVKWPRDEKQILGRKYVDRELDRGKVQRNKVDKSTQTSGEEFLGGKIGKVKMRSPGMPTRQPHLQVTAMSKSQTCTSLPSLPKSVSPYKSSKENNYPQEDSDELDIELDLWDTGGDKKFTWYRWYACTGADVVLLCVPLSSIMTFTGDHDNSSQSASKKKISKELQKFMSDELLSDRDKNEKIHCQEPPVLLVGTKSDLYTESFGAELYSSMLENSREEIINSVGLKLAVEAGCCDFVPCSVLTGFNLFRVFETALGISLISQGKYRTSKDREENSALQNLTENPESPAYFRVHSNTEQVDEDMKQFTENILGDASLLSFVRLKEGRKTRSPNVNRKPKPGPLLFFPPPPNSSPPSTGPPSSDFSPSSASSSLESLAESASEPVQPIEEVRADSPRKENDSEESVFTSVEPDQEKPSSKLGVLKQSNEECIQKDKDKDNKVPIPSPRLSIASSSKGRKKIVNMENSASPPIQTELSTPPPVAKTRFPVPKRRTQISAEKRRSRLFVKFLKT